MSNTSAKSAFAAHFFSLRGSPALSTFRLDKLQAALKASAPNIKKIDAEFVHFVFSETALSDTEQSTLKQILTYGGHVNDALQVTNNNTNGMRLLTTSKIMLSVKSCF